MLLFYRKGAKTAKANAKLTFHHPFHPQSWLRHGEKMFVVYSFCWAHRERNTPNRLQTFINDLSNFLAVALQNSLICKEQ